MMREIIFDTETTGFEPSEGHRLVEIGCVELIDGVQTSAQFHHLVNPERPIPAEVVAVHGIADEHVAGKPVFGEIADDFLAFIGDAKLVAHNAAFDFKFINFELENCGRPPVPMSRMVDTLVIARRVLPGAKHSLDNLCSKLGIDRSHRIKHGALLDAELLAQVYIELTGGRQSALALVDDGNAGEDTASLTHVSRPSRAPRTFAPTDAERAAHAQFIARMPSTFWS